jgi:hypothetical protein
MPDLSAWTLAPTLSPFMPVTADRSSLNLFKLSAASTDAPPTHVSNSTEPPRSLPGCMSPLPLTLPPAKGYESSSFAVSPLNSSLSTETFDGLCAYLHVIFPGIDSTPPLLESLNSFSALNVMPPVGSLNLIDFFDVKSSLSRSDGALSKSLNFGGAMVLLVAADARAGWERGERAREKHARGSVSEKSAIQPPGDGSAHATSPSH